jgi:hypothetical protein
MITNLTESKAYFFTTGEELAITTMGGRRRRSVRPKFSTAAKNG